MHMHITSILIQAPAEDAYAFHTDPANLLRITPKGIKVEILRFDPSGPDAIVELKVKPFPLIPLIAMRWRMRFDIVEPPYRLSDVQVSGPFRYWRQLREFIPNGPDACILRDTVEYTLPFGFLGRVANRLFVARLIRRMFDHRQEATRSILEAH